MYVVTNHIKIAKGHANEVAKRFSNAKGVTEFPGFVKTTVLLTTENTDYDELAIRTEWEEEANFNAWVNSDSFQHAHRQKPAAEGQPEQAPKKIMLGSYLTKETVLFDLVKQ